VSDNQYEYFMVEKNKITQNVLEEMKLRLQTIMGYLKQVDPINYKNQTTSSKSLGVERTNLSAALNGDARYLKKDSVIIERIIEKHPEINLNWFETGSGEMRNHTNSSSSTSNEGVSEIDLKEIYKFTKGKFDNQEKLLLFLRKKCTEQDKTINEMKDNIKELLSIIKKINA